MVECRREGSEGEGEGGSTSRVCVIDGVMIMNWVGVDDILTVSD